jgi:hypothetical protein
MVIIPNRVGQLGNQLFHIANFAASALEHGYRFHFAAFEYSLSKFPNLNSISEVCVSRTSDVRNRYQSRAFKVLHKVAPSTPIWQCLLSQNPPHVITGERSFVKLAKSKVVLCQGFAFRDPENVSKHYDRLRMIFQFSDDIRANADHFVAKSLPEGAPLLVGFHIRRGDYLTYSNGEYFLGDRQWRKLIEEARLFANKMGRSFVGIIFSNELVDNILDGAVDLVAGPGDTFTDLEMMTRCDFLIAPPSTFSGWASFIGKVPVLRVDRNSSTVTAEAFQIVPW